MTSLRTLSEMMLLIVPGSWLRMLCSMVLELIDDLQAQEYFVKLIVARLGVGCAEVRPGMNVVSRHSLL